MYNILTFRLCTVPKYNITLRRQSTREIKSQQVNKLNTNPVLCRSFFHWGPICIGHEEAAGQERVSSYPGTAHPEQGTALHTHTSSLVSNQPLEVVGGDYQVYHWQVIFSAMNSFTWVKYLLFWSKLIIRAKHANQQILLDLLFCASDVGNFTANTDKIE